MQIEKLHLGIAGAGGRGASFKSAFDAICAVRIHAVCDVDAGRPGEVQGAARFPSVSPRHRIISPRAHRDVAIDCLHAAALPEVGTEVRVSML